jgi:hypothetical protein
VEARQLSDVLGAWQKLKEFVVTSAKHPSS